MNIQDHFLESLETLFWGKILKFFDAFPDPGSWIRHLFTPGSWIRHLFNPGSGILDEKFRILIRFLYFITIVYFTAWWSSSLIFIRWLLFIIAFPLLSLLQEWIKEKIYILLRRQASSGRSWIRPNPSLMGSGNRTIFRLSVVLTACRVHTEYCNVPWECYFTELKILSFFEVHLSFFCLLMIQFVFRRKEYKTKQQWPTQSCWCSPGQNPSPEPTQTMNLSTSAWRYLALYYILFLWRLTGSAILCRGSWFYKNI